MDRQNRLASLILAVGVLILAVGAVRAMMGQKVPTHSTEPQESILARYEAFKKQADTELPRFEIGYAAVALPVIEKLMKQSSGGDELLSYPVTENRITQRIRSGNPPVVIGAGVVRTSVAELKPFVEAYISGQLEHKETSVACLIVKQLGKGKAPSCELDVDRIDLPGPVEMYDATDIGTPSMDGQLRRKNVPARHEKIQLGSLDTGEGRVVPLLIMNLFLRRNQGDPPGWQVTSHTTYIPTTLRYTTAAGETKVLPVADALAQPINIR